MAAIGDEDEPTYDGKPRSAAVGCTKRESKLGTGLNSTCHSNGPEAILLSLKGYLTFHKNHDGGRHRLVQQSCLIVALISHCFLEDDSVDRGKSIVKPPTVLYTYVYPRGYAWICVV